VPAGAAVFLHYDGSAWTLGFGPGSAAEQGNPETHLAAFPGSTRTVAVGTAPYAFGSHEPIIEAHG
jgi:hypothetical protein